MLTTVEHDLDSQGTSMHRASRHRSFGFTTPDLLTALLILLLLVAVVVPVAGQANAQNVEKKCHDHLRQIGMAILLYANENRGAYPRTVADMKDPTVRVYTSPMAKDPFSPEGPGPNDVSAGLFLLLRTQNIMGDVFVCPATGAKPWDFRPVNADGTPAAPASKPATAPSTRRFSPRPPPEPQGAIGRSNFPSGKFLGYSYANPYPSAEAIGKGYKLNMARPREFAVASDMNSGDPILPKLTSLSPDEQIKQGNSLNHKQEGQNVLFGDGRVEWARTPFCGIGEDNVFTYADSGEKSGGLGISGAPVGPADSVLLPSAVDKPSPQPPAREERPR
jgi:hypothetical protein